MSMWQVQVGVRDDEAMKSESTREKNRPPMPDPVTHRIEAPTSGDAVEQVRSGLADGEQILWVQSA